MLVGIGIGANVRNPQRQIKDAVRVLREWDRGCRVAPPIRTRPVDCPAGSPDFWNTVVVLEAQQSPLELLEALQDLEKAAGREPVGVRVRNAPRPLDLDLLFYGETPMRHPNLILPHPRMMERIFVLEPLASLLPDFRPDPKGPTIGEQLNTLRRSWSSESQTGECPLP